jgi:ribosomal protein L21
MNTQVPRCMFRRPFLIDFITLVSVKRTDHKYMSKGKLVPVNAIKTNEEEEVQFHVVLTVTHGSSGRLHTPTALSPDIALPVSTKQKRDGSQGTRASLVFLKYAKSLPAERNQTTKSSHRAHYTLWSPHECR